uniref:Glucose/Sorbosone dehydrogenase domain-containing protein n=1 Tax=Kalanchoe fedtschenkoi TaxID=63787 RepID=A0A7N0TZJ9_KALFE
MGRDTRAGVAHLLFSCLMLIPDATFPFPLCINSKPPLALTTPLRFCPYNRTSCCNSTQDSQLQKQYASMNVSVPECASLLKSIICARCDVFSAELFAAHHSVPLLCNSTVAENSSQSNQAAASFCDKVWDTCGNVSNSGSLFAPADSSPTKLSDLWNSESDFCNAYGGPSAEDAVCFAGEPVKLNGTGAPAPASGLCLEKIGNGSYLSMVPHPDGSGRAFFSNQAGKIWLAAVPKAGSGGTLELDESSPFLDLTDKVHFDGEFGLMSMALHPGFTENGRFFASFNCDKARWPGCAGRCSCNSDVNCDPSKLASDNGAQPCQFQSVVAEFTANGTSPPSPSKSASPFEVRRVFTMGLPFTTHHGGQILFGPADGHLYFMMGDGGGDGDPYNFSQNKMSLLGKIMRFDVDTFSGEEEVRKPGLWGNYSIPKDNPFADDPGLAPEIWASGLRNPWRCSHDSERPDYFMCGDVGQDSYEEVNIITKAGNYGWRVYEGTHLYTPPTSPGGNTSLGSISPIFPVMGYNHSVVNTEGSASITGGYFYRSATDPCMYGRYLYADLFGNGFWAGVESPKSGGNFTTEQIPFTCASDSPLNCSFPSGSSRPDMGYIFSFAEDYLKDIIILTSSGVYRVVEPGRCNYACSKANGTTGYGGSGPGNNPGPPSHATQLAPFYLHLLIILCYMRNS